jgi:hypothetical protein
MYPSKKLQELDEQFRKLCEDDHFPFCLDQDDFITWMATVIEKQDQVLKDVLPLADYQATYAIVRSGHDS